MSNLNPGDMVAWNTGSVLWLGTLNEVGAQMATVTVISTSGHARNQREKGRQYLVRLDVLQKQ